MEISPSPAPLVSVVVVTWNGKRYALECLESLGVCRQTVDLEVIVVDNASEDGTPEAVRSRFPDVKVVVNRSNLGFAKANNIGIALSSGRFVCLVNSDVVVPSGCFERIVGFIEENPKIGLLGPKMLGPDRAVGASVMRLPTVWNTLCCALGLHRVFPRSKMLGGFEMSGYPYDSVDDVEVLTGWFWVASRAALEQVGGLDERFFMYGEDIDWCHRYIAAGWRVVFYPEAEAMHYGAASSAKAPTRFYVEMHKANLQYFRKHHGWLGALGYAAVIWVHHSVRIVAQGLTALFLSSKRFDARTKVKRSLSCLMWLAGFRRVASSS